MTDIRDYCQTQDLVRACAERRAEIERLTRRVTQLGVLVEALADDLEAELNGHYPPEVRAYPNEQRRYERDMANVYEARRALEHKP